jgi:hypothetical protein
MPASTKKAMQGKPQPRLAKMKDFEKRAEQKPMNALNKEKRIRRKTR